MNSNLEGSKDILVTLLTVVLFSTAAFSQQPVFSIENGKVATESMERVHHTLELRKTDSVLTGGGIPSIVQDGLISLIRFLPKLVYNPSKYIAENQASFNFFKNDQNIHRIDENLELLLTLESEKNNKIIPLGEFVFDIGIYKQHDGYYFMGLKEYRLNKTLAKLKEKSPNVHVILEVLFEYYDVSDTKQEFVLEPFYIDALQVPEVKVVRNPKYQLLPKMKVLESVVVKVTEVNTKKQNWDKWLGLYEKHQGQIPLFFK